MKPGMQRDLLVAFWLLFDEFEIGNGDCALENGTVRNREATAKHVKEPERPKSTANAGRGGRPA